ncbi:MAG TPA: hypothetical protein VFN87_05250 [Solirubrobacteraceae bacterium]|nr:hypothetical protein [Solirubrobacteraceae bacterium]
METDAPRRRRNRRPPSLRITDRDRRLLAFAAEHRFIIAAQPAVLLDLRQKPVDDRLRGLAEAGLLWRERALNGQPSTYRITAAGLRAVGSDLRAPHRLDLSLYRHDLGLGWLMVAAHREWFGPVRAVISERRMRSEDRRDQRPGAQGADRLAGEAAGPPRGADGRTLRHGVRLGGQGPRGSERLHYPDMMLLTASGHRVAFELELTSKPPRRREDILAGYAADPRIDRVIYLVENRSTGDAVERSARRAGAADLVRVQMVRVPALEAATGQAPSAQRRHARPPASAERRPTRPPASAERRPTRPPASAERSR